MENKKKIFVLDTNVILHDYNALKHFADNDVVLPITVLEELDKVKKGTDLLNFHAREFMRELDKLAGDQLFHGGVAVGSQGGLLFVETGKPFSELMHVSFPEDTPDHRILSVAEYLHKKHANRPVIVVSKDVNLRLKAKALGLQAQDYKTDKLRNLENIHRDMTVLDDVSDDAIAALKKDPTGISFGLLKLDYTPYANQYFVLRHNENTALARYNPFDAKLQYISEHTCYGITGRNAEQTFALDALMRPEIQLVTITGKAGSGKTLLALAAALEQRRNFHQIFLSRPIVPLSNRDMGFLPGDAKQKINPYMQPLFDNLSVIKRQFTETSKEYRSIDDMLNKEKLVISPLAYIRGRSLSNVYFIVDEAQNLTPHEVKTIITRAGEGTKMIFTGDVQQIDSPYLDSMSNGLSFLSEKMRGQSLFAHINLKRGERSSLADLAGDLL